MKSTLNKRQLRIAALWAFSEAFLGGLLHGFKVPFSGLVLAAFASTCMAAIAMSGHKRGNIIHATILVLIVKATLSPHTPFTAYFAVMLQGLFGELIFSSALPFALSCYLNSIFALMQSAFQKLIILTILFGTGFWKAVDEFFNSVMKQFGYEGTAVSIYIIIIYLSCYLIAGIFAGRISSQLQSLTPVRPEFAANKPNETKGTTDKKARWKSPLFWILIFLGALSLYAYAFDDTYIQANKPVKLLVRSIILIIFWYFILSPVLLRLFKKWISSKKNAFIDETGNILNLIPEMKQIVLYCWQKSAGKKGFFRITFFIKLTFQSILSEG